MNEKAGGVSPPAFRLLTTFFWVFLAPPGRNLTFLHLV
jgi:hypothetical protein